MKKTIALLAATALLGSACAKKDIDPDEVRQAMPKPAVVQVGAAMSTDPGALSAATGLPAEYAVSSYWIAATFNVSTWWTLTLLQVITAFPPTECTSDSCTWGPWTGDRGVVWKLKVDQAGDGYDYVLSAHAAGQSEWKTLLSGNAQPGATDSRGLGNFTMDFDASRAVDPTNDDHGKLSVEYDNRTLLQISALFLGAKSEDPASGDDFLDIAYDFSKSATGGELQIMFEGVTTSKNLSLRTRWLEGGQGRGDAKYVDGAVNYQASQCWLGATGDYVLQYGVVQAGSNEPVVIVGNNDACAPFLSPVYSNLSLP